MDQAKRGADALAAGKYAEAVQEYTAAIKVSPTSPDYFIKRSIAYQRSTPADYINALSDAEHAVVYAKNRAKKELIVQAQLRRAVALFGLERYGDAKFVFDIVKRLDPKEKTLAIWENKITSKTNALAEDDEKRRVTVDETPELSEPNPAAAKDEATKSSTNGQPSAAAAVKPANPPPAQTPKDKIRHDWYQSNDSVTITLLAKGVPKDKATVDIQPRSLNISFPLLNDSTFDFSLEPLHGRIDAEKSTFSIMSTKIEIVLKKLTPGKWPALETNDPIDDAEEATARANPALAAALKHEDKPPSYPTSSRHGPKNWDKVVDDITKTKKKPASDKDKVVDNGEDDDDYDYDNEGGDQVNAFFQKLYAGADPDTRRAMMKSYQESNGTALSTNWEEVAKKKMETTPPEGMEAKNWEK